MDKLKKKLNILTVNKMRVIGLGLKLGNLKMGYMKNGINLVIKFASVLII